MTETYTFSRALHLMRYGGKKMMPYYHSKDDAHFFVENNLIFMQLKSGAFHVESIETIDIMGSWIEVKDA
jgi:hypothetical protein